MGTKVQRSDHYVGTTCVYWLAGRCNRNPCRFMHRETPSPPPYNVNIAYKYVRNPPSSVEKNTQYNAKIVLSRKNGGYDTEIAMAPQKSSRTPRICKNEGCDTDLAKAPQKSLLRPSSCKNGGCDSNLANAPQESSPSICEDGGCYTNLDKAPQESSSSICEYGGCDTNLEKAPQKSSPSICKYWVNGSCVRGDKCQNLHSWFSGDGFSTLANLQGHKKVITGIALPVGSDKLYSASTDGTVQIWDCHTGQCANVINLGSDVTSLITEGHWIFVGVQNAIKAWNIHTASEFTLDGPKGQVLAMVVGKDTLFAGAEDGVISAWRGSCDAKAPFEMVALLSGHTKAVVCLTVGAHKDLYSGSMDHSIKVWDVDTLQHKMTLDGHTDVVTSLICWNSFLLSSSLDNTVKVWFRTAEGTLEVAYTHREEKGVVSLCAMTVSKDILFCSCRDNSVRLYELPSFSERGRLFAKQDVQSIEIGPGGLFFTGDGTGLLTVWNWLEESKKASS